VRITSSAIENICGAGFAVKRLGPAFHSLKWAIFQLFMPASAFHPRYCRQQTFLLSTSSHELPVTCPVQPVVWALRYVSGERNVRYDIFSNCPNPETRSADTALLLPIRRSRRPNTRPGVLGGVIYVTRHAPMFWCGFIHVEYEWGYGCRQSDGGNLGHRRRHESATWRVELMACRAT
jgi:hypothetical protein